MLVWSGATPCGKVGGYGLVFADAEAHLTRIFGAGRPGVYRAIIHALPEEPSIVRRRAFLIVAMVVLAGCVSAPRPVTPVPNIYVMRHLNTPKDVKDPDLTSEGRATAEALAGWLSRDPPRVIFVSNTKRSMQTAAPTAKRFGVTPTVYNPSDTSGLVKSVLAQSGTVLVVGHSNTVPDIVAGLGGKRPAAMVHEDFGDIWRIHGAARTTTRAKLPRGN